MKMKIKKLKQEIITLKHDLSSTQEVLDVLSFDEAMTSTPAPAEETSATGQDDSAISGPSEDRDNN